MSTMQHAPLSFSLSKWAAGGTGYRHFCYLSEVIDTKNLWPRSDVQVVNESVSAWIIDSASI